MYLHNYKRASDYKVTEWLEKSKELGLTNDQIRKLHNYEIVRFAPFEFMEQRKKVKSFWLRLTIIVYPVVLICLIMFLPVNFLIKGSWGYSHEKLNWFDQWNANIGR